MDIYRRFIGNFMQARASIELAKQAKPLFSKFLEVGITSWSCDKSRDAGCSLCSNEQETTKES